MTLRADRAKWPTGRNLNRQISPIKGGPRSTAPVHDGNCGCDALRATVAGSRGEPSGESQLRPSGENGTWSVSADRIFGKGDVMEQRNVIIALFVMVGLLMIANVYTMYQVNWAIKMIGLLVENIPK